LGGQPIQRFRPGRASRFEASASATIFGNCVVLPDPVSDTTTTTGWRRIAATMSSRLATTGRPSG